jgi:hypothetical protein
MGDLLLGSPHVQFYLLVVGAGLIFALWPDGSEPARIRGDQPREGGGQTCAAQSLSAVTRGRALLAIREVEAACAAEYDARFGLALRRIRHC